MAVVEQRCVGVIEDRVAVIEHLEKLHGEVTPASSELVAVAKHLVVEHDVRDRPVDRAQHLGAIVWLEERRKCALGEHARDLAERDRAREVLGRRPCVDALPLEAAVAGCLGSGERGARALEQDVGYADVDQRCEPRALYVGGVHEHGVGLGDQQRGARELGASRDGAHSERRLERLGEGAERVVCFGDMRAVDRDAVVGQTASAARERLASLLHIGVPDVLLEGTRAALAHAEAAGDLPLEWHRVHAWPAPAQFPGTVAFGEIARVLAEHAIVPLAHAHERAELLGAIDWAIANLVLDDEMLAYRHELAERGLTLAARFLDQLGRTELLDTPDTLVDDCYFTLLRHDRPVEASTLYRTWLDVAIPRAWSRVITAGAPAAP